MATVTNTRESRLAGIPPLAGSVYVLSATPSGPKIFAAGRPAAMSLVIWTALFSLIALMNTQSAPVPAALAASDR